MPKRALPYLIHSRDTVSYTIASDILLDLFNRRR